MKSILQVLNPVFRAARMLAILTAGASVASLSEVAMPAGATIEAVTGLPEAEAGHATIAPTDGPPPVKGESWVNPQGLAISRMTDEDDREAWRAANPLLPPRNAKVLDQGHTPNVGLTNGYSRWSCVNPVGTLFLAFSTYPEVSVYRSDGEFVRLLGHTATNPVGLDHEPRWSRFEGEESVIYYHVWDSYIRHDVLTDERQTILKSEPGWVFYAKGSETALSNDGRYIACRYVPLKTATVPDYEIGEVCVVDLQERRVLPGRIKTKPNYQGVSPDGKWLEIGPYYGEEVELFDGREYRVYRIADLADGNTTKPRRIDSALTGGGEGSPPTQSIGHNGWAWDRNGDQVLVFQDNRDDWFKAWNPESGEVVNIVHHSEFGWGTNQHIATMANPECRGWFLMSTYNAVDDGWSRNQLMTIEIAPVEERPRIWRLGHTQSRHVGDGKTSAYFTEAFASMAPDCQSVWWGSHWNERDNLEVYRMELPERWWESLAGYVANP